MSSVCTCKNGGGKSLNVYYVHSGHLSSSVVSERGKSLTL